MVSISNASSLRGEYKHDFMLSSQDYTISDISAANKPSNKSTICISEYGLKVNKKRKHVDASSLAPKP